MAIPSGTGTEVLKTTSHNTTTDIANSPATLVTTIATKIITIVSLSVVNKNASTELEFNVYWTQSGAAVSPSTGSDLENLYLIYNQVLPAKGTYIFNDRIVLPQHAGTLKISTEAAISSTDIMFSYIVQDFV